MEGIKSESEPNKRNAERIWKNQWEAKPGSSGSSSMDDGESQKGNLGFEEAEPKNSIQLNKSSVLCSNKQVSEIEEEEEEDGFYLLTAFSPSPIHSHDTATQTQQAFSFSFSFSFFSVWFREFSFGLGYAFASFYFYFYL